MRTSKKEVQAVFKNWLQEISAREATAFNDIGAYRLDYNSIYGGYCIEQIMNKNGGVAIVLNQRLSAFNFVQALRMSIATLQEIRINKHIHKCPKVDDGGCAHFTAIGLNKEVA